MCGYAACSAGTCHVTTLRPTDETKTSRKAEAATFLAEVHDTQQAKVEEKKYLLIDGGHDGALRRSEGALGGNEGALRGNEGAFRGNAEALRGNVRGLLHHDGGQGGHVSCLVPCHQSCLALPVSKHCFKQLAAVYSGHLQQQMWTSTNTHNDVGSLHCIFQSAKHSI